MITLNSVTAIKPATFLYLYLSVMTTGLARKTACHQLKLYFLMLSEMRDRSVSAGLFLNLLRKAFKLQSEGDRSSHPPLNPQSTQNAVLEIPGFQGNDSVGALEGTFLSSQSLFGLARWVSLSMLSSICKHLIWSAFPVASLSAGTLAWILSLTWRHSHRSRDGRRCNPLCEDERQQRHWYGIRRRNAYATVLLIPWRSTYIDMYPDPYLGSYLVLVEGGWAAR